MTSLLGRLRHQHGKWNQLRMGVPLENGDAHSEVLYQNHQTKGGHSKRQYTYIHLKHPRAVKIGGSAE
jgi:hypothetical protein